MSLDSHNWKTCMHFVEISLDISTRSILKKLSNAWNRFIFQSVRSVWICGGNVTAALYCCVNSVPILVSILQQLSTTNATGTKLCIYSHTLTHNSHFRLFLRCTTLYNWNKFDVISIMFDQILVRAHRPQINNS